MNFVLLEKDRSRNSCLKNAQLFKRGNVLHLWHRQEFHLYIFFGEIIFSSSEEVTSTAPPEKKEILQTWRHHRTIFIWVTGSSISDALRILDDSVLWCDQAWEIHFIMEQTELLCCPAISENRIWAVSHGESDFGLFGRPSSNPGALQSHPHQKACPGGQHWAHGIQSGCELVATPLCWQIEA